MDHKVLIFLVLMSFYITDLVKSLSKYQKLKNNIDSCPQSIKFIILW